MRAADELQGPVGYDDRWLLLALAAAVLTAAYFAAVVWSTRHRPPRVAAADPAVGQDWAERLSRIEQEVAAGTLSHREGHQQISSTIRGFAAERSGVAATSMTLADLRRHGPERLADLIALIYPPAFSPDDRLPADLFDEAARRAHHLVATWT